MRKRLLFPIYGDPYKVGTTSTPHYPAGKNGWFPIYGDPYKVGTAVSPDRRDYFELVSNLWGSLQSRDLFRRAVLATAPGAFPIYGDPYKVGTLMWVLRGLVGYSFQFMGIPTK